MGQYLLALVAALVVGAVIFGITVLVTGSDPGLGEVEPDGRAVPLPGSRPLEEGDVADVRFDTAIRGYRMAQVDAALGRAAYDIGYKDELIGVLEAEVAALREGRISDAEVLRRAREAALAPANGHGSPANGHGSPDGGVPAGYEPDTPDDEPADTEASAEPGDAAGVPEEQTAPAAEEDVTDGDGVPDAAGGPDAHEPADAAARPPDRA